MSNTDISAARHFHHVTSHTTASVAASGYVMDFDNLPLPFKIYTSLEPRPLPAPTTLERLAIQALDAIARTGDGTETPDLAALTRLCFHSHGVTRRLQRGDREIAFRACACTGALYHMEIYIACGDLPGLPAGLYHYGAHDHALRMLRAGDYRGVLVAASDDAPPIAEAPVILITTSTFWRNAWKYQARAYRHTFWDTGTMLANTFAVASAAQIPATLVMGFADAQVNRLLDVDPDKEAAVSLVALGRGVAAPPPAPSVQPLHLSVAPISAYEITFPAILRMHSASSLASPDEVRHWRGDPPRLTLPEPTGDLIPLAPIPDHALPDESIEAIIRRRGSTRRFDRSPITFAQLSTALERSTQGLAADCLNPTLGPLSHLYLIVNEVEGLVPGAYVYHRDRAALEMLGAIEQERARAMAGRLALGQDLGADAAVNIYSLVDLEPVLERFGNRGYRVAQMDAALGAGKLYLAAYALGIGATGLTFFDEDVITFFSPHAVGRSVMFLMALGHPWKRRGS